VTNNFYDQLLIYPGRPATVLDDPKNFKDFPDDWHIVVADVEGSTEAVANGKQREVNLSAVGCIIAAFNLVRDKEVTFPVFFGGDGVTMVLPPSIFKQVFATLELHREAVKNNWGLNMRLGSLPVDYIYEHEHSLAIARSRPDDMQLIPIIRGSGLVFAEKEIKSGRGHSPKYAIEYALNTEGMECNWTRLPNIDESTTTLSLLVSAQKAEDLGYYSKILEEIDTIYGAHSERTPAHPDAIIEEVGEGSLRSRIIKNLRSKSIWEHIKALPQLVFPKTYLRVTDEGKKFSRKLSALTDDLMLDGNINTVLQGTADQHDALIEFLKSISSDSSVIYGTHISETAVISCRVEDLNGDLIHFIDGDGGGFTQAAKELKRKMN